MASPSELSLDMKPHSYSVLLKSFASSGDHHQLQLPELKQLEDFLSCLEDERLKIEAFKRELPLCMQLLSNAVETSRQKLHAVKSSSNQGSRPVLEEFIPLKSPTAAGEADMETPTKTDKSNWMVSAQLWSQTPNIDNKQYADHQADDHMGLNINSSTLTCQHKNPAGAGAFIPFSKDTNISTEHHLLEEKKLLGSEVLSDQYCPSNMIGVPGGMTENESIKVTAADCTLTTSNTTHNNNNTNNNSSSNNNNQPHRKARRCWSPDLHRKFVNALQMLGGSQVATPKQIRELMKVDGLTNDEVKSHLQKYRLHTRRPSPSPPTQHHQSPGRAPSAPQLVVLGGIWVPPEYAAAAAAAHHHHTGASGLYQPVGPDHHQQFVHHHHHRVQQQQQLFQIHQQQQMQMQMHIQQQQVQMQAIQVYNKNKAPTSSQSSPDARVVSESIEDGKSESGSWKGGESVENGKERIMKGGDDPESEITLKF